MPGVAYAGLLGLRLVKVTVDIDDPEVYHLYYGDEVGRPGTLLTFYCWPGAIRGRPGTGQAVVTALSVPPGALDAWHHRLATHDVLVEGPAPHGEGQALAFRDPDGLALKLIAHPDVAPWPPALRGPVPVPEAETIRVLYGMTLWVQERAPTEAFLTVALGLHPLDADRIGNLRSFRFAGEGPGTRIEVREVRTVGPGLIAVGSVHHMGIRVPDEAALHAWRERLAAQDQAVSLTCDRVYYQAITVAEPGGVRIELATDGPGVAADEEPAEEGTCLVLPPWLEQRRLHLGRILPPLRLPATPPPASTA
jgi:glyoxalase family protein